MYLISESKPNSAARNMAVDEFLFKYCQKNEAGFLRIYSWDKPSYSIGVSQKVKKAVDFDFINSNNYAFVRRITGGKTVLHNDEITYSVVSSEKIFYSDNDLYKSYKLISEVLVNAFKSIGIEAYLSLGSHSKLAKTNMPCFSFPTQNEIEYEGKKIVGSAQKRNNKALLQHGSIPVSMDYELYARGSRSNARLLRSVMIAVDEIKKGMREELINSIIRNFEKFINEDAEDFNFSDDQIKEINELEEKYKSQEWNFLI